MAGPWRKYTARIADNNTTGLLDARCLTRLRGVIERILLVYEESARRIDGQHQATVEVVGRSAGIVRRFIVATAGALRAPLSTMARQ
jgi:hypothetical protein